MLRRHFALSLLASAIGAQRLRAESPQAGWPNLELATDGGQQFWGDVAFWHEWRIQRSAVTGHCRLLDGEDRRCAWGTLDQCRTALDEVSRTHPRPAPQGTAIVVLHGLFRARTCMTRMASYLRKHSQADVYNVGYPSTRGGVSEHAAQLAGVIASLPGYERIDFVAHSLGNLVIRRWLTQNTAADGSPIDGRVGRMVMLGPPNQRPSLAQVLTPIDYKNAIAGAAGSDLHNNWEKLAPQLATPPDFGIIAGGKLDGEGWNPLIAGDDDMIVGVNETKLPGAADYRLLPIIHANMMDEPQVQQLTMNFLQHGRFGTEAERERLG